MYCWFWSEKKQVYFYRGQLPTKMSLGAMNLQCQQNNFSLLHILKRWSVTSNDDGPEDFCVSNVSSSWIETSQGVQGQALTSSTHGHRCLLCCNSLPNGAPHPVVTATCVSIGKLPSNSCFNDNSVTLNFPSLSVLMTIVIRTKSESESSHMVHRQ